LKDIRVNLFYMNKSIFANQRFDIFWTHTRARARTHTFIYKMVGEGERLARLHIWERHHLYYSPDFTTITNDGELYWTGV
jgi:hypothetical protein